VFIVLTVTNEAPDVTGQRSVKGAYTVDEAALWLGINRRLVYRLMAAGQLPWKQCGPRKRLISLKTLQAFVEPDSIPGEPA
jgi:excisionase family DNA binding protein